MKRTQGQADPADFRTEKFESTENDGETSGSKASRESDPAWRRVRLVKEFARVEWRLTVDQFEQLVAHAHDLAGGQS